MAIGLLFFSAIKLSEHRMSYWPIQETIRLSDIGSSPQSKGQSDIGLRKNFGLPTSASAIKLNKYVSGLADFQSFLLISFQWTCTSGKLVD